MPAMMSLSPPKSNRLRRPPQQLTLLASSTFLVLLGTACAHPESAAPPGARASAASSTSAGEYICTQIMGVSVTGDWFNAGFEQGLDKLANDRWQVVWRKQAFVELWADPTSDLWSLPPQSPCASQADNPDRVLFTAVNWTFTTQAEWARQLERVVANIKARYPRVKRIDLLTMLRGPSNQSCGNPKTVVAPYIDQAITEVSAHWPGLVFPGPRVEVASCEVFTKGGPHYTEAGMAVVGRLYASQLPRLDAAGCACRAKP